MKGCLIELACVYTRFITGWLLMRYMERIASLWFELDG